MLEIGCHLSAAKGFYHMGKEAVSIGANTFQCFVRNPRGSRAKAMDPVDLERLRVLMAENGFGPIVAHAPYIMNPCSKDDGIRRLAEKMMREDLALMEHLPGNYYNFHPGSHVGQGLEAGTHLIADMLNRVITPKQQTVVLLETMAGKGSEVGRSFEEIQAILDRVELSDKLGVCLDTCHVWDAGYDICGDLDGVLTEFDRVIGLDRLRAVHLNNSLTPCGSHKDRHAVLLGGAMPLEAIRRVVNHPALRGLPMVLETPNDLPGYAAEIRLLRQLAEEG